MSSAIKVCPACGQTNPATSSFCPNCGRSLGDVDAVIASATTGKPSFTLPKHLIQPSRRRRRYDEETGGAGFLWVGFGLIAVPILLSQATWLSIGVWFAGVAVVILGYWQLRRDRESFSKAGIATAILALAALSGTGAKLVTSREAMLATADLGPIATVAPTAAPDWLAATEAAAGTSTAQPDAAAFGVVPMYRAEPAHTGAFPGPGPNGKPYRKWRFDSNGEVRSSPAVSGGVVYFGTKDGYLNAVDSLTGRTRWQFDLGGYPVRSSPAISNRTVFVGGGYTLYAINADTGEERWRFAMRYAGESSPTIADGVIYVASKESQLYAIDIETGTQKWVFTADGLLFSSPAVAYGFVFIGSDDGNLYAIDAKTGQKRWTFVTGGEVYSSPAVINNRVYVTSKSRSIFAVDALRGKEVWQYPVGGESSPAVVDGTVYVGADDGGLYALDAATGLPKWLYPTGRPISSSPAVTGGTVYIASGQTLFAVDSQTGDERWQYATGDIIGTSPTVVDGLVLIGAEDGYLYAVAGDGVTNATPTGA